MKHIGRTAFLLAVLLAAALAVPHRRRPRPGSGLERICRRCCFKNRICPAICDLSKCNNPALGQCPFVDKRVIKCNGEVRDTCYTDKSCLNGQRCCDTGCSRNCTPVCQPACKKGVKCIYQPVVCVRAPCKQPKPFCEDVKKPKPGTCPVNDLLLVIFCVPNAPDNCSGDSSCAKIGEKCCSYGCARNCVKSCRPGCRPDQKCVLTGRPGSCLPGTGCPGRTAKCVPKKDVNQPKPGTCPVNDLLPFILCPANAKDTCSGDNSCDEIGEKCCSYGCGRNCVKSCLPACRPDQKCVLTRPQGPCPPGTDCPLPTTKCVLKNPCLAVKCRLGFRCVVRSDEGKCEPLPPRPGFCPADNVFTICSIPDNACSSDAECDKGQKCCRRGCNLECLPACRNCRPGQTCRSITIPCKSSSCAKGAACVDDKPVTKPGVCPRNDIITTCQVRDDACSSDAQCDDGQKCCSRGCGRTCVSVCKKPCPSGKTCKITVFPCLIPPCLEGPRCVKDGPVTKPGVCPRNDIITICQVRKDACSSDAQCDDGQKCCSRGCGRACVSVCKKPYPSGCHPVTPLLCGRQPCSPPNRCEFQGNHGGLQRSNGVSVCVLPLPPTCAATSCPVGSDCVLQQDTCNSRPCSPRPVCVPQGKNPCGICIAPSEFCELRPSSGAPPRCRFVVEPRCDNKICPPGEECGFPWRRCIRAPCPVNLLCLRQLGYSP